MAGQDCRALEGVERGEMLGTALSNLPRAEQPNMRGINQLNRSITTRHLTTSNIENDQQRNRHQGI